MSGQERFFVWLEHKASEYLTWRHEQEFARAKAREEICPDCDCPESFCCCDSRQYTHDDMDAAFADGAQHAYETASRGDRW